LSYAVGLSHGRYGIVVVGVERHMIDQFSLPSATIVHFLGDTNQFDGSGVFPECVVCDGLQGVFLCFALTHRTQ